MKRFKGISWEMRPSAGRAGTRGGHVTGGTWKLFFITQTFEKVALMPLRFFIVGRK